jgi:hypothetical protein
MSFINRIKNSQLKKMKLFYVVDKDFTDRMKKNSKKQTLK